MRLHSALLLLGSDVGQLGAEHHKVGMHSAPPRHPIACCSLCWLGFPVKLQTEPCAVQTKGVKPLPFQHALLVPLRHTLAQLQPGNVPYRGCSAIHIRKGVCPKLETNLSCIPCSYL